MFPLYCECYTNAGHGRGMDGAWAGHGRCMDEAWVEHRGKAGHGRGIRN